MSNELDLERLSESIKHTLQENTVIILRVPVKDIAKTAISMKSIEDVLQRYKISAIICPDTIDVIVVPPDSKFKIEERLDA